MKKLFTFFLTLFVASSVWAYNFEVDGISYNYVNDGVEVTNGGEYSGNVTIPSSVTYNGNSYSVTSIGEDAFYGCRGLTSVTIPNSVTSIGDNAFSYCRGLTSVTIPNSVTEIGEEAFYDCSGLTSITIPNSVTSIGYMAFSGCSGLTSITIPNSVTSIGYYAFYNCSGLTSITIPNSVTSIGDNAFSGCSGLTSITIPNSVTSIGHMAFYDCSGLTSITIPNSVTSIGYMAFSYCDNLTYNEYDNALYLGNSENPYLALIKANDSDITSCVINEETRFIGEEAFYDCRGLTSVTIPNSVTSIGERAFSSCSSLTSVTIPNSVTSIGSGAFKGCSSLTSVTIPNSVTSIGSGAFKGCSGLTSVTIPNSVTSIGTWAFDGCSGLTSVTIPNSVTEIGEQAFCDCSSLTSISIPSSVNYIGEVAFFGCTSLKKVTCYAVQPPEVEGEVFENLNAYLYVPCQSIESYDLHSSWGNFKYIKCIESESVELSSDAVSVEAKNNEATFSMPLNSGAKSYTLTISNNGAVFCTLNFNENGQLVNIDFSTTKSYELKDGVVGYQFTVTGLSAGTNYTYKFVAKNSAGSVLKEYTGAFSTTGTATAVTNVEQTNAITISNNQILVNGEAPAFVVTVAGQKIANANLKSGVYFVVVDDEMVGVSIR